MPRPFHRLTISEFAEILARFPFSRKITSVHLHHTWKPRQSDFRGLETIEGMWRYHTQNNHWSDIAQHLTIDPNGGIWTGRSWNRPPASASGFNGISSHGPFMIEMIGDFDEGRETLTVAQREAVLAVLAHLHVRFRLHPRTLRFHNQMSGKTCPGSSIVHDDFVAELAGAVERLVGAPRAAARSLPFADDMLEDAQRAEGLIRGLLAGDALPADPPTAELMETTGGTALLAAGRGVDLELTPEVLDALRPHVINLRQGMFSGGGHFETSPEDVEALVHEHLEAWRGEHNGLQLMLWAHGGLNSEKKALIYAHQSYEFWKDNGIYPIYFVWETGIGETIGQLLKVAWDRIRGKRDIFDVSTDLVVENLVRAIGGVLVWGGMKRSAEKAASETGGGRYFVDQLRLYLQGLKAAQRRRVGLHAAGHSAGSIFHSHLVPELVGRNGPLLRSLHFLAPAVTADLFKKKLSHSIGDQRKIRHLSVYTMRKGLERRDNVIKIYRKSLLYLIHRVLERRRKTPILGLEKSLRRDRDLVNLFGLAGQPRGAAEIVWSRSASDTGTNASQSATHGGFDNDPSTMNSVLRQTLGLDDHQPIRDFGDYPAAAAARALGGEPIEDLLEPEALDLFDFDAAPAAVSVTPPAMSQVVVTPPAVIVPARAASTRGSQRALCVGIDEYPSAPLQGCVNDSRTWAGALGALGVEVVSLTNAQATRDAIMQSLADLIGASQPGDLLVFQYAGHGTQMPDLDGDEEDGKDETFVPYDYESGAYLLDDDLGKIFDTIPAGVNLTNFIDCCHSGTINRMVPGDSLSAALHSGSKRMRFIPVTGVMAAAHKSFRRASGLRAPRPRGAKREVHFGACQDHQSAWESNGQGDFTRIAAPLLAQAVAGGWSHDELQTRIEAGFAGNPRQLPNLVCEPARRLEVTFATGSPVAAAATTDRTTEAISLLERAVGVLRG